MKDSVTWPKSLESEPNKSESVGGKHDKHKKQNKKKHYNKSGPSCRYSHDVNRFLACSFIHATPITNKSE